VPEALLIALPVVGGFLAATRLYRSRFRIARDRGYRFYFRVGYYALILVGGAVALVQLVWGGAALYGAWSIGPLSEPLLREVLAEIFHRIHAGKWPLAVLAFGLGSLAHRFLNLRPGAKEKHIASAIFDQDFELMVEKSLAEEKPMMITLKTGQVYVGWAVRGPNPEQERRWLRILPLASGYRDEQRHVRLQVNYAPILKDIQINDRHFKRKIGRRVRAMDFEVVLSIDDISGMHLFDIEVYRIFDPDGAKLFVDPAPAA